MRKYIDALTPLPKQENIILSDNHLGKHYWSDDVEDALRAMNLASGLGIAVPQVHRAVKDDEDSSRHCVIMDRIKSNVLHDRWPELGWLLSIKLAFQLRWAVQRMRLA